MGAPLGLGVPYRLGDGWFDPTPLVAIGSTLLLARWFGFAWSRATIGPLLVLGLLAGYAVGAWGVLRPAAAVVGLLALAVAVIRRSGPGA
jgi:uncharacterized membrane protein (Fun14 family)